MSTTAKEHLAFLGMNEGDDKELATKLKSAVTQYDMKQQGKKGYNHYALSQYLSAVDRAMDDFKHTNDIAKSLKKVFDDRLLDVCLKAVDANESFDEAAEKFDWTRDSNGGGFTGIVHNKWKAHVLNNGSWTLYKWGDFKAHSSGKAPSVMTARSDVAKASLKESFEMPKASDHLAFLAEAVPGMPDLSDPYVDSKKFHQHLQAAGQALGNVSVPHGGEWGNVLSVPEWHVQAYDTIAHELDGMKATSRSKPLHAAIEKAKQVLAHVKPKVADLVKKGTELNNSGSKDFQNMLSLHAQMRTAIAGIAMARYDEGFTAPVSERFTDLAGLVDALNQRKGHVRFSAHGKDTLVIENGEYTFSLKDTYKWGVMGAISGFIKESRAFRSNRRPVTEADKTNWVMDDDMKTVLRDAEKYLSHAEEEAYHAGASELRLILHSMKIMLVDLSMEREPKQPIVDIGVSVKILKKAGYLK